MNFCIVNSDGIIANIISCENEAVAKEFGALPLYDGASIGDVYAPIIPPAQLRENAYNTQAVIAWDGEMLTVTEASQKWQYYAAEGNTDKTDELTALIAEAKSSIREQFPDEEGNTQALMGQKNI